jgi:hypothetical protein
MLRLHNLTCQPWRSEIPVRLFCCVTHEALPNLVHHLGSKFLSPLLGLQKTTSRTTREIEIRFDAISEDTVQV